MFSNPPPENRTLYEIMWGKYSTVRQATDDNIIRRMRFVYWINKNHTNNTYSVEHNTGFTHCLLKYLLELHFRFSYEFME